MTFFKLVMPTIFLFLFHAGALTAGLFILMAGYFKKPDAVICCMCVAGAAAGTVYAGFQVNMLDIAPRNASVVMGIVNAASNTAGFLSPMLVGFITHRKVTFSVSPLAEHDSNVSRHWNQNINRVRCQVSLKILAAF